MDALPGWNLVISLLAILFVAWLSGRLLGVSRSLPATVLAGLTGWLAALALSLASCWPSLAPWPAPRAAW